MTKSGETAQWLLTIANTLNTIGDIMEKVKGVHNKLPDWAQKRIEATLAGDTKEAKKSVRDEILFGTAVYALHAAETAEMTAFEAVLRKTAEHAPKAEALVLFVAKGIDEFKRENKKYPTPKQGEKNTVTEQGWMNYRAGLTWSNSFLRELLARRGATPQETLEKRLEFLEGKNVFSLITPAKVTPPIVVKAIEVGKKIGEKIVSDKPLKLTDIDSAVEKFAKNAKEYRTRKGR